MSPSAALACRGLQKSYGRRVALHGVDLVVEPGQLVGLLGPNGAGKSTLVKVACGLVRATGGQVTVLGEPAGSIAARRRIGYLAELFRYPAWLRAEEVLTLHQRLAGSYGGRQERGELLDLVGLQGVGRVKVAAMSKGMQQRLGLAQALVGDPALLLLDEPTSALDPAGRRDVRDLLGVLRDRGVAVLLNSHLLTEVELVCDHVTIVDKGKVVAAGTPADLTKAQGVEVVTADGVLSFPSADRAQAPAIVADLVGRGVGVEEVRVLRSTLEDAYLAAVSPGGHQ